MLAPGGLWNGGIIPIQVEGLMLKVEWWDTWKSEKGKK
jgi:hypothetical protein